MKYEIYISPGNRRMKIPTFSIPVEKTCNPTEHCKKYCYARKAENCYPNVLPSRERNYRVTKSNDFIKQVSKYIMQRKPKLFRIHESGDFYSQGYFDKWMQIAILCPDTKFLAYTQMYDLDVSPIPSNFILYYSIWDDSDLTKVPPNSLYAFVYDDTRKKLNYDNFLVDMVLPMVHKCVKEDTDIGCEKCQWCFNSNQSVKFQIH